MRSRAAAIGLAALVAVVALVVAVLGAGEEPGALTNWQALVLGLVQGATELLPISSSGHLILVPWAADWTYLERDDEFNQTFDVALHLGTLVAVVAYVLWIADQRPTSRHLDGLTIRDAVIIGTAQAAALAPGVSRSGITISAGRVFGRD